MGQLAGDAHRLIVDAVPATARTDYAVLAGLDESGLLSQAALGRRLGVDPVTSPSCSTSSKLTVTSPVTSRAQPIPPATVRKLVQVTPAGRRRLRRLDADVQAAQNAFLAPLNPEQDTELTAPASTPRPAPPRLPRLPTHSKPVGDRSAPARSCRPVEPAD